MANVADLGFRFYAQDAGATNVIRVLKLGIDDLNRGLARNGLQVQRIAKQTQVAFGDVLATAAGLAVIGTSFVSSTLKAGEFERQIGFLGLVSQSSGAELERLRTLVLATSRDLGLSAVETAKAASAIARLGFTGKQTAEVLRPALELVVASFGELDPDKAGKLIGQTLKSFGKDSRDSRKVADELARAVSASALDFQKLGLALGTTGGFAASFGSETSQLLALLGLARDVIERTERGATGIRNIFRDLTKTTVQNRLAQADLGITVVDQQGKFRDIFDILIEVEAALRNKTEAERLSTLQDIFSIEAATVMAAIFKRLESGVTDLDGSIKRGADGLRAMGKQVAAGNITLSDFMKAALGPLPGQLAITQATIEQFGIALGRVFGVIVGPALSFVTFLFDTFITVITKTGVFGRGLAVVLGIVGVGLLVLIPLLLTGAFLMKSFALLTSFATVAAGGFFATIITGIKALLRTTIILGLISVALGFILDQFGAFNSLDTPELAVLQQAAAGGKAVAPGASAVLPGIPATTGGIEALISQLEHGEGIEPAAGGGGAAPAARPGQFGVAELMRLQVNLNVDGRNLAKVVEDVDLRESRRRFEGGGPEMKK